MSNGKFIVRKDVALYEIESKSVEEIENRLENLEDVILSHCFFNNFGIHLK